MGFVKSPEEIARIAETVSHPRFVNAEMLRVDFLTDPAIVARLLPPTLEPAATPLISVNVGRWQSNCAGDFEGGSVYIAAKYGEIEAAYVLAMYMSTDQAIIFGREVFGEPKKHAAMGMNRRGTGMAGWVSRHGVRLIEIDADLGPDLGASEGRSADFNIKALPATDGRGLEDDPILSIAEYDVSLRVNREGTGSVVLRGTKHDPLDEIEVRQVLKSVYIEGDMIGRARNIGRIPAGAYLPYYYGRTDDWSQLNTEAGPISAI